MDPKKKRGRINWRRATLDGGASGSGSEATLPADEHIVRRNTDSIYSPANVGGSLLFLETIKAYNLKWPKLRDWLTREFAAYDYVRFENEQNAIQDKFKVWLPKKLTKEQRESIHLLRERAPADMDRQRDRRAYSPDKVRDSDVDD